MNPSSRVWNIGRQLSVLVVAVSLLASPLLAEDPPSVVGPLLKLYRSGKLPTERQPAVIEMICVRGNENDLRVVVDKLLDPQAMTVETRLKAIAGLTDAATTRKVKPAGDLSGLVRLLSDEHPQIRLFSVRLLAACHVQEAISILRQMSLDKKLELEVRRSAIAGLVAMGGQASRETLVDLASKSDSPLIRLQAAAGLTGFELNLAATHAANVLATATPQDEFAELLDAFFNRKDGSAELAGQLKTKKLSVDVAKKLLRTMYSLGHSDAELSSVLSDAAGIAADAPPPKPEEVAELIQEVAAKGDARRGEQIFRRADLSCMRCHSISRAGGQVGPDLSAVGGASPLDYIANSILNPNLAVKEQYVTRVFETSDGKVLSGVVVDRDETRVRIRDAQGKLIVIPAADIEDETAGVSMMPQGLTKFLTHQELLDLIRFVSELGKPGEYAVQTTPRIQRWLLMVNPPDDLIKEVPHLEKIRQLILGSSTATWTSVYARVSGSLPLEELRSTNRPAVVILRGEFDVKEAGMVVARVDTTEQFQAWIDAQPAPPQSSFEMHLDAGLHSLILRLEISDRQSPELRANVTHSPESTARLEIIGGK